MQKSATIFADQDNENESSTQSVRKQKAITLSRDQYREVVKEAYKEGVKDAEKEERQEQKQSGSLNQKAKEEAKVASTKELEENKQRFETIVARQDIELLRAKTVFPFTLFPDILIIDTTKVTIARKQLFATEYVVTIPLKDLADVTMQTALFMASLTLRYMPQTTSPGMTEPVAVKIVALRRKDAFKAKNILKGALVAKAEEIDIAKLDPEDVKHMLEKFGQSEGVE